MQERTFPNFLAGSRPQGNPAPDVPLARKAALHCAIALIYLGLSRLGGTLTGMHDGVSLLWPATGFGAGVLLLGGFRYAYGLFVAEIIAHLWMGLAPAALVGMTALNMAEALGCAGLIQYANRKFSRFPVSAPPLAIVCGSLAVPAVGAGIGTALLSHAGLLHTGADQHLWFRWWAGGSLGCLLIIPAMWAGWAAWPAARASWRGAARGVLLFTVTALSAWLIFNSPDSSGWIWLLVPLLVLAAEWFGDPGPHVVALVTVTLAVGCTLHNRGPFPLSQSGSEQVQFEIFLFCLALTTGAVNAFRAIGSARLPGLIMSLGWFLSGLMLSSLQAEHARLLQAGIDKLVTDVSRDIEHRLDIYIDALRGVRGLYQATPDFNHATWLRYVENFDLHNRYPGINGFGIIFPVVAGTEEEYLRRIRLAGVENLTLHTMPGTPVPAAGSLRFIISYLAPIESNRAAIGLDLASETIRRLGAEAARDSGLPCLTARLALVQDSRRRPGFLLFLPMYRPGLPLRTVEERRTALLGWTYAPFITENFLAGVLQGTSERINLQVFHGPVPEPDNLVFSTRSADSSHTIGHYQRLTHLKLGGQDFLLGWDYLDRQTTGLDLFAVCASFSPALGALLVAGLVLNFQTFGQRAQAIAEQRTKDLQTVNARLQSQMVERARAEAATRRAMQAAEAASKAKSEFLATMSHELRTPMNSVLGFAELLQHTQLTARQAGWLRTLRTSGETLLSIINDILDFSKIEAGKLQLEKVDFDPPQVCAEAVRMLETQARAKGLALRFEAASVPPGPVSGDPGRFRQVVLNLTGNAIKFTATGSVTISAEWQEQGGPRGRLRVSVLDTGPGIDLEKQTNLFQMFTQADASDTRRHGGTGLGLAISKRLVELMGGTIGLASTVGQGSTFWFELPLELSDPAASAGPGSCPVLVLEPPGADPTPLASLLGKLHCGVTTVPDPARLLTAAGPGSVAAVFLVVGDDLAEACSLTEKIRRQEEAAAQPRMPVIGVATLPGPVDMKRCLAAGMDTCLAHPLTLESVGAALQGIRQT